jgi:hypothetical protein
MELAMNPILPNITNLLCRDPWWLFSILTLFHVIRTSYNFPVFQLINKSPRFGILLAAIFLSFIFTGMDFLASLIDNLSVTNGYEIILWVI